MIWMAASECRDDLIHYSWRIFISSRGLLTGPFQSFFLFVDTLPERGAGPLLDR